MASSKKGGISQKLMTIVLVPMILLMAATTLIGYNMTLASLTESKSKDMASCANLCVSLIDAKVPGDYFLQSGENNGLLLYKGEEDITLRSDLVDSIYDLTGMDVSIIYGNTRILTTIYKGNLRILGTGVPDQVAATLSYTNQGVFYNKTKVEGVKSFAYYLPIYNSDDSQVGAIEICMPLSSVTLLSWRAALVPVALELLVMVILILVIQNYNKGTMRALDKLLSFTRDAASGNDAAELDPEVTRRNDEYGEMGASVLAMHRSLRDSIDRDALTKLYNRRSANRMLDRVRSHYQKDGEPYSVAIGDIDFFKRVNDTYGHDAGDIVLCEVSRVLRETMKKQGFAARWGGEEFLLVFDRMDLSASLKEMEKALDKIRALRIEYEGKIISLTMSFGLVCEPELNQDDLIRIADSRLYYAKENGRNQIRSIDEDITE